MKEQDFRVGNIVDGGTVSGIHQVLNDEPYTIELKDNEGMFEEQDISEVRPIPLTEEWLLKYGFEKNTYGWYQKKYDSGAEVSQISINTSSFRCNLKDMDDEAGGAYAKNISYVHQLQNLFFALTGKELEIMHPA